MGWFPHLKDDSTPPIFFSTQEEAQTYVDNIIRSDQAKMTAYYEIEKRHDALLQKYLDAVSSENILTTHQVLSGYDTEHEWKRFVQELLANEYVPETLEDRRRTLKVKLERIAASKRDWITGVTTVQGSHLEAGCLEQKGALDANSALMSYGKLRLDEEDDIDDILAVFKKYERDIKQIRVLNTPVWHVLRKRVDPDAAGVLKARATWDTWAAGGGEVKLPEGMIKVFDQQGSLKKMGLEVAPNQGTKLNLFSVSKRSKLLGSVPIAYTPPDDDAPPYGRHTLGITARNACGPSELELTLDVRDDISEDEYFRTARWTTTGGTWAIEEIFTTFSNNARTLTTDTTTLNLVKSAAPIKITPGARYDISTGLLQVKGDRVSHLIVEFLDASGNQINQATYGLDITQYPKGWKFFGDYCYFGLYNQEAPSIWTKYAFSFGGDGLGQIPAGAVKFHVGAILAHTGTTETKTMITSYKVFITPLG